MENDTNSKFCLYDKKGSIAIFITVILLSMLLIVSLYVNLAGLYAGRSIAEGAFEAGGRSILSEYNREFYKDYGIFGLSGKEDDIERKLFMYVSESINQNENIEGIDVINLDINSIEVSLAEHSLLNISSFEKEMINQMKYLGLLSYFKDIENDMNKFSQNIFALQLIENSLDIFESAKILSEIGIDIIKSSKIIIAYEEEIFKEIVKANDAINLKKINQLCKSLKSEYSKQNLNLEGIIVESQKFEEALIKFNSFLGNNNKQKLNVAGKTIVDQIDRIKILVSNLNSKNNLSEAVRKIKANVKTLENTIKEIQKKSKDETENFDAYFLKNKYYIFPEIFSKFITDFGNNENDKKKQIIINQKQTVISRISLKGLTKDVVLKNEIIINGLPSRQANDNYSFPVFNKEILEIFSKNYDLGADITNDLFVSEYILVFLKNNQDKNRIKLNTFYKSEVEYVLGGRLSEKENLKLFELNFIALRAGFNLIHIYTDPTKLKQVKALALLICPTPWSVATEFLIASAWSTVEASNDLRIIKNDGKIPLVKSKQDWAIDYESFVNGNNGNNSKTNNKGLGYKEYLRIFLILQNKNSKILRTMDIIQIDMKGRYNEEFSIKEHYNGFDFTADISKKEVLPFYELFGFKDFTIKSRQLY